MIANTIIQQIKATDFWSLGAWGAQKYVALPDGVRFKIRTPRVRSGGYVEIRLDEGLDLYNVRVIRVHGTTITELDSATGIYCDQLVEIIDGMIEYKREVAAA